jgi:hypothetical protein
VFFHDFAQIEPGVTLSAAQIGNMFRIEAEQVRSIGCRAGSKGKGRHRRLGLDVNQDRISFK